jgi:iron complex transport system substrate-binding protein
MKRHLAAWSCAAIALISVAGLGGCGDSESDESKSPGGSSAAPGAFPVDIDTKFGAVTIDSQPSRIVALGWGDAETVLALGGQPIAASDWLGFGGDGVGPWLEGAYDSPPKILGTLELSYEEVAALEPDLILDVRSSGDQDRYDRLTQIAPTVGVPEGGDAYLASVEQQVTMISAALGQTAAGEGLLTDLDAAFADAAAAHPEWDGLTATAATRSSEGWGAYVVGSDRVTFLERLGFVQNPTVDALDPNAGAQGFYVSVSGEQLDVFEADLIVAFPIWIDPAEITDDPMWQRIPAVAAGHSVMIDGDLSNAYSVATVPGNLYALEHLTPLIEEALAK